MVKIMERERATQVARKSKDSNRVVHSPEQQTDFVSHMSQDFVSLVFVFFQNP